MQRMDNMTGLMDFHIIDQHQQPQGLMFWHYKLRLLTLNNTLLSAVIQT